MKHLLRQRPATTLIELLIFMGILGIVVAVTIPMLFSATENRLLQTTISIVEQNGAQILGNVSQSIRASERILSPAAGQTGAVLVMQTASGSTDPTIIGLNSGALIIVQHLTRDTVSTEQVAVTKFVVRNTSTSTSHQSISISFTVSRTIRLQQPHSYSRAFEATVVLFPTDVTLGNSCGCVAPTCAGNGTYEWEACEGGGCYSVSTPIDCP